MLATVLAVALSVFVVSVVAHGGAHVAGVVQPYPTAVEYA